MDNMFRDRLPVLYRQADITVLNIFLFNYAISTSTLQVESDVVGLLRCKTSSDCIGCFGLGPILLPIHTVDTTECVWLWTDR